MTTPTAEKCGACGQAVVEGQYTMVADWEHGGRSPLCFVCDPPHSNADLAAKSGIVDQPPPQPSTHEPSWEALIRYTEERFAGAGRCGELVVDMRERHRIGVERYGVPLQAGNGRDHLIDAYQELLDMCVYLMTELIEMGHPPAPPATSSWDKQRDANPLPLKAFTLQELLRESVCNLKMLRKMITRRQPGLR